MVSYSFPSSITFVQFTLRKTCEERLLSLIFNYLLHNDCNYVHINLPRALNFINNIQHNCALQLRNWHIYLNLLQEINIELLLLLNSDPSNKRLWHHTPFQFQSTIFWYITLSSLLKVNQTFRRNISHPLSGLKNAAKINQHKARSMQPPMKTEAFSSKTSVRSQRTAERYIPEDGNLQHQHHEKFKSPFSSIIYSREAEWW